MTVVMMSRSSRVSFRSGVGRCAGHLVLPLAPPEQCAGVVLCNGFGSTMDRLYPQAEGFAEAGFVALVFDYRNFGASDGRPRQLVDVPGQQADVRAAVAYLRGRDEVDRDRVVLWGNSLGGAHAISVAAEAPDIAAVAAQIPFNGFPRRVAGRSGWDTTRLLAATVLDGLRGRLRLPPYHVPLVGRPGQVAITNDAEAYEHIATLDPAATLWRNRAAPRALLQMMRYHPAQAAARLRMPLLVCLAADDRATPETQARQLADVAPAGRLERYPGTHFSFYTNEQTRRAVLADQIAFYQAAVAAKSPRRRDGGR